MRSGWVVTAMTPSFRGHMTGSGSNGSTLSSLQQLQRLPLSQSVTELSGTLTVSLQRSWLQQQETLGATDASGSGGGVGGPSAFST